MRRARRFKELSDLDGPIYLAAGFFDGVHRGHQRVIAAARAAAAAGKGRLWVMTFDTHPLKVLAPERAPLLLTSADHKAALLEALGVDGCLSLPFNRTWAALSPTAFLNRLNAGLPGWRALFIGRNWRFGRHAAGDIGCLRRWAKDRGIAVTAVSPARCLGQPVSSTRTREAVAAGDLELAARLLGRPFSVRGTVQRGRRIGRQLGFPTANVLPDNEVRPPSGVYAVGVAIAGMPVAGGVLNWGVRPTVPATGGEAKNVPACEVHLFDQQRDLYGCRIEVFFMAYLRQERRFEGLDALRRQIGRDAVQARRIWGEKKRYLRALQMPRLAVHCDPH